MSHHSRRGSTFIAGGSFDLSGQVTVIDSGVVVANLTGWTGRSQIRDLKDQLIADLTVTIVDGAQRLVRVHTLADTSGWPAGQVKMNILFIAPDGTIVPTGVTTFEIEKGVTV